MTIVNTSIIGNLNIDGHNILLKVDKTEKIILKNISIQIHIDQSKVDIFVLPKSI